MNNLDRDNLMFFLSADDTVWKEWYAQATVADKSYAVSLLNKFQHELELYAAMNDKIPLGSLEESKSILQKFRLSV